MRDPRRIHLVLNALEHLWNEHPDLRLGQLISNLMGPGVQDVYHLEDVVLLSKVKAQLNLLKPFVGDDDHAPEHIDRGGRDTRT